MCSAARRFALVALLALAFSYAEPGRAVPPELQCSTPGTVCRDVEPTPWTYIASLPFPHTLDPPSYSSLAAIIPAIRAELVHPDDCSFTFNHVAYDSVPGPWMTVSPGYTYGVETQRQHAVVFDWVHYQAAGCPHNDQKGGWVRQHRDIKCPKGYTLVYEAGPPVVGPYCALPAIEADREKSTGSCKVGQIRKGDPCDIGSGNQYEAELDYAGSGSFPLRFERHYNSWLALAYPPSSTDRWRALGHGWTADYLQKIVHSHFGSHETVSVFRPDGQRLMFKPSGANFIADADVNLRLTAQRDGSGAITGWVLVTDRDETETYDAAGKLVSVKNRGGITHTLQYDSNGVLESVTHSFGQQIQFDFDDNGRLSDITLPGGASITYDYTGDELLRVTYPDTKTREYVHTFHSSANTYLLAGVIDESATQYSTFAYNAQGLVESNQLAGGVNRYEFGYYQSTGDTGARYVKDPLGQNRTYDTKVVRNVHRIERSTAVCPGCGESKWQAYDANGNISGRWDFNTVYSGYAYDLVRNLETGRVDAWSTPAQRYTYTTWHPTYRLRDVITEGNRTTDHDYDASGNLTQLTITDTATSTSRTSSYTYDSFGRVLTANGPRTDVSDVTTYTYYGTAATCTATVSGASVTGCRGQLETVTNALSHLTTFNEYNAHGQALKITDPNGVVTTLTYDARQRLTSRDVGGATTTIEYWPTGLLKKVTLPDSSFLAYTYDAAHRLKKVEDDALNRIEYTLDAMGNRTAENTYDPSNVLVRAHSRVYDTLNQLWKDVNAAGTAAVTTVYGYDLESNLTSIAAPLSRNTSQLYDELNRLKQITDPRSGVTRFAYNRFDELTQVTDPRNLVTTYSYNNLGDLTQLQSPDTGTTTSTYDSGGNLATRADARSKTGTYAYDALNRVTSIAYPDQTLVFAYDAGTYGKGHLTGASDANHSLAFTHDAQGRVTGKSQTVGTVTKSVGYGFTDGKLTSITTPSGQTITYGYADGRVSSLTLNGTTTILNQVLHDPFGPIAGWTWGNSTLAVRTYDADGKIAGIDSAGATTYGYDDAFRITGITDLDDAARSWTYGYDLLDRLTSGARSGQTLGYTYDANGNRLTQSGTQTASYTVSGTSNRLSSITGTPARTYAYDAAGNVTGYAGLTFAYSDAGRMKSLTSAAGTTHYTLNALGQRVKKSGPAGTRLFVYDEAGHLLGEYEGSGALVQETVWLGDIPVATLRPNGGGVSLWYVHTDHLNTPRRISRPSDNVIVWRWDSDPFGSTAADEDPDGDSTAFAFNLRFPGQYHDAESGLSYNYFRDYDPAKGGYIQSDPIGLQGGLNTYAYVGSRPVMAVDPFGLRARACCRLIPWVGVIGARHCYIERDVGGKRTTWGLIGNEGGPSSEYGDIFIDNGFDIGGACGPWKDDCYTDQCVEDAANLYPNPSYYRFARGPNSNTFAGTVARQCGLQRPAFSFGTTPGWYDPQAKQQDGTVYRPPERIAP
jgi:RHS repeat-associated protein